MNLIQALTDRIEKAADFQSSLQAVCQYLRDQVPHYSWVGVYMIEGEELVLKAWDGPAATGHERIPIGKGVCGRAARDKRSVLVNDVNKDPDYLACFVSTRSEIVVPLMNGDRCVGDIDIDSDTPDAFDTLDKLFLEWLADRLVAKTKSSA